MICKIRYPLLALAFSALPAWGAATGWTSDFEAAKELAAEGNKDLLMEFTGSDWCHWCAKLKEEVFEQPTFATGAAARFVLVELDYPRNPARLDAATRAQNAELAKAYGIQGYPTVILADAEGRPYASTGYQPGGVEAYLKHLDELRTRRTARDQAFAEAVRLNGVEKAKALQNALGDLDDHLVDRFFPGIAEQIEAADPEDRTGFTKGRHYRKAVTEFESRLDALFAIKRFPAIVAEADAFIEEHQPIGIDKQRALMPKVLACVEMGKKEEAFRVMEDLREAAPYSELSAQMADLQARLQVYFRARRPGPASTPEPAPPPAEAATVPASR